jgi:SAM-dependent methyltransferase
MLFRDIYTHDEYLTKHPTWHVEESPWKVQYLLQLMARNHLAPQTICEVGCGAGEILRLLEERMDKQCRFWGYEISPQAYQMAMGRANERLQFMLADLRDEPAVHFDLILIMDVLEHLEDYFSLLRAIHPMSEYKIVQIPLDVSVRSVLSGHLIEYRELYGHIHYFTKELGLWMLRDVGYDILDYCYAKESDFTPGARLEPWAEVLHHPRTLPRALFRRVRRGAKTLVVRALGDDMAERIFGEWRLMMLAK